MRHLNRSIAFLLIIVALILVSACKAPSPLTIDVKAPADGSTVRTNLVRVSGSVSERLAALRIQGSDKQLKADGTFSEFLQLHEGENFISISADSGKMRSAKTIKVTFIPPVAVYLMSPILSQPLSLPVTVPGYVFPSQALVRVNDIPVPVDEQGAFSAKIKLEEGNNIVRATATLSGSEDTSTFTILVQNGVPTIPPGQGLAVQPILEFEREISIMPGQTVIQRVTANPRKSVRSPQYYAVEALPVNGEYSRDEIPLPDGINIALYPNRILLYPNTEYEIDLSIQAESLAPPGAIWILLRMDNTLRGWAKLEVAD